MVVEEVVEVIIELGIYTDITLSSPTHPLISSPFSISPLDQCSTGRSGDCCADSCVGGTGDV